MTQSSNKPFELSIEIGEARFAASGPSDLVLKAFDEFKDLLDADAPKAAQTSGKQSQSGASTKRTPAKTKSKSGGGAAKKTADHSGRDPVDASKMTLPELMNEVDFGSNAEIGAAIVIWANDKEGKSTVTRGDIGSYWAETKHKAPANLSRDISKAKKSGWIKAADGGYKAEGYGRKQLGFK